ncbi:MAG: radical SAM protein [Polyangiales bacterium]
MEPLDLQSLTSTELVAAARARLEAGAGAALRVHKQVVREGRFEPEALGLGARASAEWRKHFRLVFPEVVRVVEEEGDLGTTAKAVLRLADGYECECVLIPMGRGRHTLCVSSQVGCKMGCTFCETGRMGLLRHMTAAEIVSELLVARHVLGWDVKNVVFMGMGEALDNADAVFRTISVCNDGAGMQMPQERFTVCSVGHVEGLERFMAQGYKRVNLSFSLNSPDDAKRSEVMPINRKTPLARLQALFASYQPRPNFVLGVNYCLMPGINDSREDAAGVARFCGPIPRVLVNVIPYNPGNAPLTRAPTEDEIVRFIDWLRDEGLPVRRRITKGRSVMAACGQLGNVELRERRRRLPVTVG